MKVHNTLTRKKEEFIPTKGKVGMYVCGITPYDSCHLGHARCYVAFDVIRRYLETKGFRVLFVQNFTDLDDKIIERAKREGVKPQEIANRYTDEYFECMDALNVKRANIYPRVTQHIKDIIEVIRGLIDKGYAYRIDGGVYFEVAKFPRYGMLSSKVLSELAAGARIEVDSRKRSPLDFALWREKKDDDASFESPWGYGRPGWHIECSTLAMKYLGESFDVHGGGEDLIFPHHENEIAQSESYSGKRFVKYWIHNGFVNFASQKMSKSLGNVTPLKELLKSYSPEIVRFFLLTAHYREPINFTYQKLNEATIRLERFSILLDKIEFLLKKVEPKAKREESNEEIEVAKNDFMEALEDDFNTPRALAALDKLLTFLNRKIDSKILPSADFLFRAKSILMELGDILGLDMPPRVFLLKDDISSRVRELVKELRLDGELDIGVEFGRLVDSLVEFRQKLRTRGEFSLADRVRAELSRLGIILEDYPDGTRWRVCWRSSTGRASDL